MDFDIGRFLAKRAALDGGRAGLIADGRTLSFRDLDRAANRAAHALRGLGVRPGDRVAVLLRNGIDYIALYYAAAKLGAILCGINWRLAAPEVDHILRDSEPALLIHDMDFTATVDALAPGPVPVFAAGVATRAATGARRSFAALLADAPDDDIAEAIDPDAPLVLVYTSGTTGRAKGAVLTHRQMGWVSTSIAASHDYTQGDVSMVPTPLFHVGGLSFATLFVHMGATLLLPRVWEPGAALRTIAAARVNHFFAVPAMLRGLLDHPDFATADLSSLRWILSGGAPLAPALVQAMAARGIPLLQTYGATETAGPATTIPRGQALNKAGSAGLPYFHAELRIVDGAGRPAAPGTIGDIHVRAPHLFAGYWRNKQATAEAFAEGWLKTGDLGRLDEDGYLFIVDRAKDMIISGGENIYPAEIEAVLGAHPAIAEVAVVGTADPRWGEVPCAVAVLKPGAHLTLDALRDFCEGKLARFKFPRRLELRADALPRNATGKLVKPAIRAGLA